MKSKKAPAKVVTPDIARSDDVNFIKTQISKANLYLSLLDRRFFAMHEFSGEQSSTVQEIEQEVHQFVLGRVKALFCADVEITESSSFNTEQIFALKRLADKVTGKTVTTTQPAAPALVHRAAQSQVEQEPEENEIQEEDEEESSAVMPVIPTPAVKEKAPVKQTKRAGVVTRKVTIKDKNGVLKDTEVAIEKMVLPPPELRRAPPASYEQQYAAAMAAVQAQQRSMSKITGE